MLSTALPGLVAAVVVLCHLPEATRAVAAHPDPAAVDPSWVDCSVFPRAAFLALVDGADEPGAGQPGHRPIQALLQR